MFAETVATLPDPKGPEAIGWIILVIGQLIAIATSVAALLRSFHPQKRDITIQGTVVNKDEYDKHRTEARESEDQLHSKIGGVERGLRGELKQETKEVREAVSKLTFSVGALTESNLLQNQRLANIDAKLDRLIERRSQPS